MHDERSSALSPEERDRLEKRLESWRARMPELREAARGEEPLFELRWLSADSRDADD